MDGILIKASIFLVVAILLLLCAVIFVMWHEHFVKQAAPPGIIERYEKLLAQADSDIHELIAIHEKMKGDMVETLNTLQAAAAIQLFFVGLYVQWPESKEDRDG